ncbi:MAG: tetratricopeptide repeat protein [Ruminococcaceae bacterium]|nr:tetratricopeptide repeat protein [Oscillospiraceae bacterium]
MKTIKILRAVVILLLAVVVGLYVYEVAALKKDPTENLMRIAIIIAGLVITLIRLRVSRPRRSLDYYEAQYQKVLRNAFADSVFDRKKLLCAVRLYNEDNFRKAAKYLVQLQPKCRQPDDYYAVGMFLALIYTDLSLYDQAVMMYHHLIGMNLVSTTLYGNLGYVYSMMGDDEKTLSCYSAALDLDPKNAYAQHNIANFYFDKRDFENAIENAKKALELDSKLRPAATLLAIIYSLEENKEEAERYFHLAITCGEKPDHLRAVIEEYRKGAAEAEEEE